MAAIICKEPSWQDLAMGSFYDQNNVIISKFVAWKIEKNKSKYLVLTSIANDNSELSIDSVYYNSNSEYGILKVSIAPFIDFKIYLISSSGIVCVI